MTDPIADFLTRIKNASLVKKERVAAPFSKVKMEIGKILEKEGYIESAEKRGKEIEIKLKYGENGKPKITNIKRISKPGRRIYKGKGNMPRVLGGYGIAIISSSGGITTNNDARRLKIGGEVICEIW